MPLTDAAALAVAKLLKGDAQNPWNNANSHIGVGDSTTAFAKTQTDLVAATNKLRRPMDATFPIRTNAVLQFSATFGTSQGNFVWNEWGVFNALSAADMLNRKVESLGTKPGTQTWQLVVDLAIAA